MFSEYSSVGDVIKKVKSCVISKKENISLETGKAVGFFSGMDVISEKDWPEWDVTHMDGYAVRFWEESYFMLVGQVKPGQRPSIKLGKGEAVYVPTGSYLPEGTDTVLRVEECTLKANKVITKVKLVKGKYIYERGSDFKKGDKILREGERINVQHIPPLLALGYDSVKVRKPLNVALVATGNELSEKNEPGKVRNTHTAMISSFVIQNGCEPKYLGIVGDEEDKICMALKKGVKVGDVVLITGGTSMGRRDVTVSALKKMEPQVLFHGVKMDRGRVTCVAVLRGKPVIVLPGPIQATMNALVVFFLPLIKHMMGLKEDFVEVKARIASGWRSRAGFEDFTKVLYVKLVKSRDGYVAEPLTGPTESMRVLFSSNGVVIVPEEIEQINKGSYVHVKLLPGFSLSLPLLSWLS